MRVLHTSDWHIGKRLYQQPRYDEFAQFLTWLIDSINEHAVDVLIVAGDVFDTATPSNKAQELYYQFLGNVAKSCCQHVIITAGNHDSPTFLDAPKDILRALNVQVIGQAADDIFDEILVLRAPTKARTPQAIVLAVPYLRDKDVRKSARFERIGEKENEAAQGIYEHYHTLAAKADELRRALQAEHGNEIPIIATGHLFAAGASISAKDDGMRQETYVGTLGQISAGVFAECLDYVALGHIHAPQKVAGQERIRYCGSPMAMGFGEAKKPKQVLLVDFIARTPHVHALPVPVFQKLASISGDLPHIHAELDALITAGERIYAEIIYTGETLCPELVKLIHEQLDGSNVLALSINNRTQYRHVLGNHALSDGTPMQNLQSLTPTDAFARLLTQKNISDGETSELTTAYQAVLNALQEADEQAE
ncbi:hypothetical protein B0181_03055 [Moraxella caviae]|uniref:Nuclease SbcCD subunit D n=1 Tax=Moraxella caviae TaxID=34060 RepID=A0A1T0A745_9GAMM|nr:hypothetical protein B0181_03055 [Moraxella caviae]